MSLSVSKKRDKIRIGPVTGAPAITSVSASPAAIATATIFSANAPAVQRSTMIGTDVYLNTPLEPFGKKNVLEFIQNDIKQNDNFETILMKESAQETEIIVGQTDDGVPIKEDHSARGFFYERLWDLCIKFGVTPLTKHTNNGQLQTSHLINGNLNIADIDFKPNCWAGGELAGYLRQSVRSGNSGGYSDITFINKFAEQEAEQEAEETQAPVALTREELCFVSVKYFKEEKEIGKYDIGKLCALIRKHEKAGRAIKIYIFVNDKEKAIEKFKAQHSSSDILIKYINPGGKYENIYDTQDLHEAYFKLKKLLAQYNYLQTIEDQNAFEKTYLEVLKSIFIPRFHQKLFITKINERIDAGEKNILVGAIPRSGKSYIMAGTILDCVRNNKTGNKLKFLMMTPAPNETFGEYNDIFHNYIEFEQLGISVVTYDARKTIRDICQATDKHCVIIISKQKLGWSGAEDMGQVAAVELEEDYAGVGEVENIDPTKIKNRIIKLLGKNPEINVMFLDEAHFGMTTDTAQQIVQILNSVVANTVKIYVTATYNKPLKVYGVNAESKLTWDMNDIKIIQEFDNESITDNAIATRFGEKIYIDTLRYFGDETGKKLVDKFKKEYAIYPKPYLITSIWDKNYLNTEKLKIGDTEFGWDMNKLFATKTGGGGGGFENTEQITEMMRYYFGYPDKAEGYDKQSFYRTRGILPRINKICVNKCRTLQSKHKTTQLWFLPLKGGGTIKEKVKALIHLLSDMNEFKDIKNTYHFFVAVDMEDSAKNGQTVDGVTYMDDPHMIKRDIEAVEKKIKNGTLKKDNLIILTGNRLQLGISLRNVDIVTLWNSTSSADAIFQMLFRSMTEVDVPPCAPFAKDYCAEKKFGFMVDMNPQRALTNVQLFRENITNKNENEKQHFAAITDLINIDQDVYLDQFENNEEGRVKFVDALFNKLSASWVVNVKEIKQVISKFSYDAAKLEKFKNDLNPIKIEKNGKNTIIEEPLDEDIMPTGKSKVKIGTAKKTAKEKKEEIALNEKAGELISEFISLLNIFTLYTDSGSKCILTDKNKTPSAIIADVDLLKNKIYANPEEKTMLLKILNGRLAGNADDLYPEDVIDGVLDAMNNSYDTLLLNKVIMEQKTDYYNIHTPDKLIEEIIKHLKPKEKEKKENGEVFTPPDLIKEILDKLDDYYKKETGKSIFSEPHFTWFDPAVGIGNFPVMVYLRLMHGLETFLPDEESRRKHILEKMLYMSELEKKNTFICKKIFCSEQYKLNLYEGNTLTIDPKQVWGVEKFDVIMGNPPYNKGGIRSHTGKQLGEKNETIWPDFIEKAFLWLKPNGFLAFINPLIWLKLSSKMHVPMLEKYIIWLKLWDNIKSLAAINGKIPISLYVLQNKLNSNQQKTEIISEIQGKHLKTSSTEYLNPKYSIPLAFHSIFTKLIEFIEKNNCRLEIHTKMVKSTGEKIKLPFTYTLEDQWAVDTYTIKEGIMVKKATEMHPDANKRKLIIANKSSFRGAFIDEGKLGLTGGDKTYILGDHLELVSKLLSFKISSIISNYAKYRMDFLDRDVYTYLPDIRKLSMKDITEDAFYQLIGFTLQEINQIKNPNSLQEDDVDMETLSQLSESQLAESQLADSHLADSHLADSHLADSHLADSHLADSDETLTLTPPKVPGKLFNPNSKRWVNNTPANQKKISRMTKGGKKKSKTKKSKTRGGGKRTKKNKVERRKRNTRKRK